MSEKDDGGPAFPIPPQPNGDHDWNRSGGMSLRDYFAIHAPEPTIDDVKFEMRADAERNPHGDSHKPPRRATSRIVADLRYAFADAMLAGRKT